MENQLKTAEKVVKKYGKPTGKGLSRFLVLEMLITCKPMTVKEIGVKLLAANQPNDRKTISAILNELKQVPPPGYLLFNQTKRNSSLVKAPHYSLVKNSK